MALPAWEELAGSPKEGITVDGGPTAERLFLLNWSSKATFYQEMWDNNRDYPGFGSLFLTGISTEPFSAELCPDAAVMTDPTSSLASYSANGGKVLLARVQYGFDWGDADWPTDIAKPSHDDGTELALQVRFGGDIMLLPARDMAYYAGGGAATDPEDPRPQHDAKANRLFVSKPEYQIEWRYVDDPPTDTLRGFMGHTNSGEFLGVPSGCLRFDSFELDAGFTLDASDPFCWTVRCIFSERRIQDDDSITWNHDYCGNPAGWKEVVFSDDEYRYPSKDFSTMFQTT